MNLSARSLALLATLLLASIAQAAPLPTATALRSLFVVEQGPVNGELGQLYIRNQFDARPFVACDLRKASPAALTFTDQEGGVVRDMRGALTAPPAAWDAAKMDPADFTAQVRAAGRALESSCVDVDLAPVAETNTKDRSYSNDPAQAAAIAARFASALTAEGVTPTLKHYPGKLPSCQPVAALPGFTLRPGSHEVENCPGPAADVWRAADAFPLDAAPLVMLSNRVYPGVSPLPAVLDPVYTQRLRARGFRGLVLSDALWEISTQPGAVVQALKSVDVVLVPSPRYVDEAIPAILAALQAGQLDPADMAAKLKRVAAFRSSTIARRAPTLVDVLHLH